MLRKPGAGNGRTYFVRAAVLLPVVALLFALGIAAPGALAGRLSDTTASSAKAPPGSSSGVSGVQGGGARSGGAPSVPDSKSGKLVPQGDAFMTIDPSVDTFGSLGTNPSSGDTVNTGDRFA